MDVKNPTNPQPSQPNDRQPLDILAALGLNLDQLRLIVEKSTSLEQDEEFFAALTAVAFAKNQVKDVLEAVEKLETDAKGLINAKAKALYGPDWQVIKGQFFKISRQFTGSVYEMADPEKVEPDYLKVKFDTNTKAIDNFRETHDNQLPTGVAINEHRGESIRISIKQ